MKGIKKILFGISLILLGTACLYASSLGEWGFGEVLGLIIPAVGILFSISGLISKD